MIDRDWVYARVPCRFCRFLFLKSGPFDICQGCWYSKEATAYRSQVVRDRDRRARANAKIAEASRTGTRPLETWRR